MAHDLQDFQAAYRAWKAARREYDDALEEIIEGRMPFDKPRMLEAIAELNRLHAEFMEKAKPFVRLVP